MTIDQQCLGWHKWLRTAATINVIYICLERPEHYLFRRMQQNEQAALKQQRNALQKTAVFHARALAMQAHKLFDLLKEHCLVINS